MRAAYKAENIILGSQLAVMKCALGACRAQVSVFGLSGVKEVQVPVIECRDRGFDNEKYYRCIRGFAVAHLDSMYLTIQNRGWTPYDAYIRSWKEIVSSIDHCLAGTYPVGGASTPCWQGRPTGGGRR